MIEATTPRVAVVGDVEWSGELTGYCVERHSTGRRALQRLLDGSEVPAAVVISHTLPDLSPEVLVDTLQVVVGHDLPILVVGDETELDLTTDHRGGLRATIAYVREWLHINSLNSVATAGMIAIAL